MHHDAKSAVDLRPELLKFALAMENQLRQNDSKRHWRGDTGRGARWGPMRWFDIANRIRGELTELRTLMKSERLRARGDFRHRVTKEAADVANFAMMMSDIYGE